MPASRKLKVFRTSIGFHDAYVAAPSQKAALAAWGSDKNLFAMRSAELVTDPALTREALSHPGQVVKRSRGGLSEQLAALPKSKPAKARIRAEAPTPKQPTAKAKPKPRPSRARLDRAEFALEKFEAETKAALLAIREREDQIRQERSALSHRQRAKRDKLDRQLALAREAYEQAMRGWRE